MARPVFGGKPGPEAQPQAGQPGADLEGMDRLNNKLDPISNKKQMVENQTGNAGEVHDKQNQINNQPNQTVQNGQNKNNQFNKNNQVQGDQQPQQQKHEQQEPTEPEPEQVDVDSNYEEKVKYIQQKFDGKDDLVNAVNELESKLGVNGDNVQLNSPEEAIDYYMQLEKQMGQIGNKTGNVDNFVAENQRLKDMNNRLQRRTQMLMAQLRQQNRLKKQNQPNQINNQNNQNMQPRNNQGQFVANNQLNNNQNQASNQNNINNQQENNQPDINIENLDLSDVDKKDFMKDFYKNPAKAIAEISSKINQQQYNNLLNQVNNQIKQQTQQNQQPQQPKQQELMRKKQQAERFYNTYKSQAEDIKQEHGEEEFNRLKPDIQQVLNEYPIYLNPNVFPDGFKRAFQEARRRRKSLNNQQNQQFQMQQQQNVRKQTASMPGSQGNTAQRYNQNSRNVSKEDLIKQEMFQEKPKKGVFG